MYPSIGKVTLPNGFTVDPLAGFWNLEASQNNSSLVTAVPGKRIVVLSLYMVSAAATSITLQSNDAAISPAIPNGETGGAVLNFNPLGWMRTNVGEALKATSGAGGTTGIGINYVLM